MGEAYLCRHPFQEKKRAYVKPSKVEPLYQRYWDRGELKAELPSIAELKDKGADEGEGCDGGVGMLCLCAAMDHLGLDGVSALRPLAPPYLDLRASLLMTPCVGPFCLTFQLRLDSRACARTTSARSTPRPTRCPSPTICTPFSTKCGLKTSPSASWPRRKVVRGRRRVAVVSMSKWNEFQPLGPKGQPETIRT